ncbi:hypothetical protein RUR49_09665 [Pseudoxanthobacter sp. M-2]|uniref:hypothetical protein n=1 Tax=Pseudoxanthobacter sp. M-2 TaxID=3078754 RepID=UPI0038FD05B8
MERLIFRLLPRLAMWIRRPPSPRRMLIIAIVVAAALAIAGIERYVGWPEALTVERLPRNPVPQ